MYDLIKKEIYDKFLANKDKPTAILWSGGPYSSTLWFVAYKDLNLRIPVLFIDTGDLPPTLYAHIAKVKQVYNIDLTIFQGKLEDVIKEQLKSYEILYSGRSIEGGTTIIPDKPDPETWNFIRSLNMPFFGGVKKGFTLQP